MKAWEYLASIEDHQERMKAIADVKKKLRQQMAGKSEAEIKVAWDEIITRMKQVLDDKLSTSQKKTTTEHKSNKFKLSIVATVVGILFVGMLGITIYSFGELQKIKYQQSDENRSAEYYELKHQFIETLTDSHKAFKAGSDATVEIANAVRAVSIYYEKHGKYKEAREFLRLTTILVDLAKQQSTAALAQAVLVRSLESD